MLRLARHLPRVLFLAEIVLVFWILHDAAYVTTFRLYINHRVEMATRSNATQRFDIEGDHVVPQILMRPVGRDDRVAFRAAIGRPSTLRVELRPEGRTRYEIVWKHAGTDRVLAAGEAVTETRVAVPVPAQAGVVELVGHGPMTWVDPRLVRDLRIAPQLLALTLLLVASAMLARLRNDDRRDAARRIVWFRRVAFACGVVFVAASVEIGLRALGGRVPASISSQRHDLGEVGRDPRWEETLRYGRRLRPRVDALSEWRHGDIVRMGYIPADVSDGSLHRFRFHTDEEGFRNTRTRERIDVAALGDSFTDAMTLDARDGWTTLLERRTGLAVQNYGTAGFGPQQELRVLTDYVVRHHPRIVVLSYFAGNDLFDAEAFDEFVASGGAVRRPLPGWQIKDVVSRADSWFLVSALRAVGGSMSRYQSAEAKPIDAPAPRATAGAGGRAPAQREDFDRGMFTLTINDRAIRFAFMPPYLNTLNFSERDLTARSGWTLTRGAIAEMQRVSRAIGAELVVMLVPFKSQVYLPLLAASMPAAELSDALHFYFRDDPRAPDVAKLMTNRLAQNAMLRRFCDASGIRFLDTTDALTAHLRNGENVYFPDESHLNETGHRIVADTLGKFLDRSRSRE